MRAQRNIILKNIHRYFGLEHPFTIASYLWSEENPEQEKDIKLLKAFRYEIIKESGEGLAE